jgi:hypothetical protein
MNLEAAAVAGLGVDDVRDVLIAVAPIIGSPKVLAAAAKITDALGYALATEVEEAVARGDLGPDGPPTAVPAAP